MDKSMDKGTDSVMDRGREENVDSGTYRDMGKDIDRFFNSRLLVTE